MSSEPEIHAGVERDKHGGTFMMARGAPGPTGKVSLTGSYILGGPSTQSWKPEEPKP